MKITVADDSIDIEVHKGFIYDIPMDRMQTPAAVLDWIHQICVDKTWGRENAPMILDAIFDAIPSSMWSDKG
jgi:hypothetical protein